MILGIDKSIFRRLLFSYMLTILLGLCAVGILMSFLTKDYIVETQTQELLRKAKRVNLAIQNVREMNDSVKDLLVFFDQSFDTRIWVFDRTGQIVATSSKDEVYVGKSVDASVAQRMIKGEEAVLNLQFEGMKDTMLSVVVPWGKEKDVYGGIVLHAPVVGMNQTIAHLRETILWVTLFGIVMSVAIASLLSWSISRPLRQIEKVATRIGLGDYSERIDVKAKDEIGELAGTINRMVEQLERIDREKRKLEQIRIDFLGNVSHELRTPLTAMQGFLEALQDGLIVDQARPKYYGIIYKETLHMSRLVDDIMDLVKLENNAIVLERRPVEIEPLLKQCVYRFSPEAEEKGTSIALEVHPATPLVFADPDRLQQIVNNLVKNALKFTDQGTIRLAAAPKEDGISIVVSDTGTGISPEDQELIWERFFKVDRGRSKTKGTGLGLAIVRELVSLHEGKITVASEVGKGTTFEVWLPQAS